MRLPFGVLDRPRGGPASPLSRGSSALLLVLLFLLPGALAGQTFDFPVIPRGAFEFEMSAISSAFDTRFAGGSAEPSAVPLGAPWRDAAAGTDLLPQLAPMEERIRALTGDPDYQLRLGVTAVRLAADEIRIPFRLSYGITSRITLGVTVPLFRQRIDASHGFSPEGADVGANPAETEPGLVDAFLMGFGNAVQESRIRAAEICAELGENHPECMAAREVVDEADLFLDSMEDLFGAGPAVPLSGSPAGSILDGRTQELRSAMLGLGITDPGPPLPLPDDPLGPAEFRSHFIEPLYGASGPPVEAFRGIWEVGDVEISLNAGLLDLELAPGDGERTGVRFRSAAGVRYRVATAEPDTLRNYVDMEEHRGHSRIDLRSFNDLSWRDRAGLRVDLRYAIPGSAEVPRRIAPIDRPLDPAAPVRRVRWTPGREVELDLAPRLALTRELAIAGRYSYLDRGQEDFELAEDEPSAAPDLSPLIQGSEVELHRVGLELLFSTVGAWEEDRTRFPFEVRAGWRRAVTGTGERAPRAHRIHAAVRFFIPR